MRTRLAVLVVGLAFAPSGALGQEWVPCAHEREMCHFAGMKMVRYGASERFVFGAFTDGVECSNHAFGADPIGGVRKSCWTYQTAREAAQQPGRALRLQEELQAREQRINELQAEVEARGQRVNELQSYIEAKEHEWEELEQLREEVELRGERVRELEEHVQGLETQLEWQRRLRRRR